MARAIVRIADECDSLQLVEKCRDEIKRRVKELVEINFTSDVNILVRIRDLSDNGLSVVDSEVNIADMSRKQKRYVIDLDKSVLEDYVNDDDYAMSLSLYHEVAHVLDAENYINSKYAKFNPFQKGQKSYENYSAEVGWHFWTEFYAYDLTYRAFGETENAIKFSQLYKSWMVLEDKFPILEEKVRNNTEDMEDCAESFVDDIKAIVYSFSKYLGSYNAGKSTYRRCPQNKESAKAYKRFLNIGNGFCTRLVKLETNTYGKGMYNKLVDLGDYIITKFMLPFGIAPIYSDGRIRLALYLND